MTRLPRPSLGAAALTVALLALVLSLGGASYAASLAKGVVGTAQLKKGAVTSAKVKDGSLTKADFAPGQLPAGPAGPAGAKGDRGPSDAYGTRMDGFSTDLDLTLPLPAGSYFVSARVGLFSASVNSGNCNLVSTGTGADMAYVATPGGKEGSGHFQGLYVLPAAGSVSLQCADGSGLSWGRARVEAIAVGATHVFVQP